MTANDTESKALYVSYLKDTDTNDGDWVDRFYHALANMEYERNHARAEADLWRDLWAMKGEDDIATAEMLRMQNLNPWEKGA